jgi:PAS domain S-box-containing protein
MTRLLIVDDKEENLYLMQALFGAHGYVVDTARHGAEALVKARLVPPDAIVSDLLMPVMDGYTLLRRWKTDGRLGKIPFIVYTATYTEPADEKLALDLGADAFILKPTEPGPLAGRIAQVLTDAARGTPVRAPTGAAQERDYSEIVIRKLEEKARQLEEANEALAEREEQLRAMFDAEPECVKLLARNGVLLEMNPAGLQMIEADSLEQIKGTCVFPLVVEETRAEIRALCERVFCGESARKEFQVVGFKGTARWLDMHAAPVRNARGEVIAMIGISRDITARRRADEALRESERRTSSIIDSMVSFVGVFSLDGVMVDCNRVPLLVTGMTRDEVIGQRLVDLPPWTHSAAVQRALSDALQRAAAGEVVRGDFVMFARGMFLTIDATFCPLRDASGKVIQVVGSGVDVTERKRLEAQLLQAQKMEALGTLAGGIAHDFNNILGAIIGNAALAHQDVGPDHPAAVSLAEITKASSRARDLIQQILTFSRQQAHERRVIGLPLVIEECVSLLRATLPTGIALVTRVGTDIPNVLADRTQVHQVVMNLCTNAWQAIDGPIGRIELALDAVDIGGDPGHAPADLQRGRYARLRVSDSGKGIDAAIVSRIFDPFFTTKALGEGTGLGLAVVDGIVKNHDGAISVDSVPGKGTTFQVYFPAVQARADTLHGSPASQPKGAGERILYLDDEEPLVLLVSRLLERLGYQVEGFTRPADALAAFDADPSGYALFVSDLNMPVTSGLEVAAQVLRRRPDLPVVLTSGYITEGLRTQAASLGVREVIYKPNTADELAAAVARLLADSETAVGAKLRHGV